MLRSYQFYPVCLLKARCISRDYVSARHHAWRHRHTHTHGAWVTVDWTSARWDCATVTPSSWSGWHTPSREASFLSVSCTEHWSIHTRSVSFCIQTQVLVSARGIHSVSVTSTCISRKVMMPNHNKNLSMFCELRENGHFGKILRFKNLKHKNNIKKKRKKIR